MVANNENKVDLYFQKENYENVDCPFTELVSLLKSYKFSPQSRPELAYSASALQAIYKHADNATKSLLFGLQALGHAIGVLNEHGEESHLYTSSLGYLIQFITNLIEALHQLCTDINSQLGIHHKQVLVSLN